MSPLEITEVAVHLSRSHEPGPLLGFARIVLNGAFVVNGIRIIQGRDAVFISFPRELSKRDDGKPHNICYPIRRDVHDEIIQRVLAEYTTQTEASAQAAPRVQKEY